MQLSYVLCFSSAEDAADRRTSEREAPSFLDRGRMPEGTDRGRLNRPRTNPNPLRWTWSRRQSRDEGRGKRSATLLFDPIDLEDVESRDAARVNASSVPESRPVVGPVSLEVSDLSRVRRVGYIDDVHAAAVPGRHQEARSRDELEVVGGAKKRFFADE